MAKILVFGAHALDAELMGGPYCITRHDEDNDDFTFVHMTRGERGNKLKSPVEYGKQLEQEIPEVAKTMGGKSLWTGYIAGQLPSLIEITNDFKKILVDEDADTVITHWRGSLHDRHILCHDAVTAAVNQLNNEGHHIALFYGENCEDLNGFIPELYVKFSQATLDKWIDGLNHYELFRGGVLSVPYYDYYTTMAKIRGIEKGILPYARAFMVAPHSVTEL